LAGGPVQFIGRVGVGAIGAALVTELLDADVDERVQREGRAGTIAELVDADGEKSILPDRGAATELEDIDGVSWLHVPAYSLVIEPLATTTARAIRAVQQTGGTVSSDASSVAIVDEVGASRFSEMLAGLGPDVVLYNQDEDIVRERSWQWSRRRIFPMCGIRRLAGDAYAAGFIFARMALGDIATALGQGNQSAAQLLTRHSA
jgi:sugar/nucleoside kinase (ribokinase family)